ncbi:MAG: beta-ketoacyl-ACP synthase 3 [Solirubrobacteraceae bacterium]|nr:beta-ketoacyl-ACP synthase 3 [Solirubrobacteraceae bacterium]
MRAAVLGLGAAVPPTVVTSAEIAERIGVEPGWIERRTGIETRRHLQPGETMTALASEAARAALADAGVDAGELDLVLCATTQGDNLLPNLGPQVAAAIGATSAGGCDVGAACAGFVAALPMAAAMIETGRAQKILLIGADGLSRYLNHHDKVTAALFGDGAGAIVLAASEDGPGIGAVRVRSDGDQGHIVGIPGTHGPIEMDGHATFLGAINNLTETTREAVLANGLTLDDIDLFVYHQANRRILNGIAERLEIGPDRVVDAIAHGGNTSAASLPLALNAARDAGRLLPGTRVLLGAVGSGFTWGAGVLTW